MNELFLSLGIEGWKPLASTLLLPPVPMLLLVLVGARLMFRRRLLAWLLILLNELKRAPKTAIVVLGGGRGAYAPKYGMSTLHPRTVDRLRHGLWLARETNLPWW
jgi:hypothetical protein